MGEARTRGAGWIGAMAIASALAAALPAKASAPPGRYQISTNGTPDDVSDDTVLDVKTQLRWQRAFSPPVKWDANAGPGSAQAYCAALSVGALTSGWRLPQIREMETLVDTRTQPAFDAAAFPGIKLARETGGTRKFWTATPYAGQANTAWVIGAGTGRTGRWTTVGTGNQSPLQIARCVHAP